MEILYTMPGSSSRLFINIVHACPNACLFCVDFKGDTFYGFNLKGGKPVKSKEVISAISKLQNRESIQQVFVCGIGEPLLLYDTVIEVAKKIRQYFNPNTVIAINTSGTHYLRIPQVDFSRYFDLIQVSLNAENEEKYNQICRPKIGGAYRAMMCFLDHLKNFIAENALSCKVELTVVDTSNHDFLPDKEKGNLNIPIPDIEKCKEIAASFNWPLKVKPLIEDCENDQWTLFADTTRRRIA